MADNDNTTKEMKIRTILALAMLLMPSLIFALQKQERLYVYGIATSFNDSTVYITDIQQLDSAWVDAKPTFCIVATTTLISCAST